MKPMLPASHRLHSILAVVLLTSFALLTGCDAISGYEEPSQAVSNATPASKLRHAHLMDRAVARTTASAGKAAGSSVNLILGLQTYEADGITPRVLNQYDVTRRLLDKFGDNLEIKITVGETIDAITVKINETVLEDFLADVAQDPDIAWVEPDALFDFPDSGLLTESEQGGQIVPWSVQRVGAADLRGANFSDVHVFVLDSGVGTWDLELAETFDFTPLVKRLRGEETYRPGKDLSGHGTHIAGIIGAADNTKGIRGIAARASIHNLKVMTADGISDMTTLLAAIEHVTLFKVNNPGTPVVVNLSLGADIETTEYNALDEAIDASIQKGVVYVIAAGNDGRDAATYSPAHVEGAITVGAYNAGDVFASFSNYGPVVDLLAPGEVIVSLPYTKKDRASNTFILRSGTSHAAPHVTGAVARYLFTNPQATPDDVRRALLDAAQPGIAAVPAGTTDRSVMIRPWRSRDR